MSVQNLHIYIRVLETEDCESFDMVVESCFLCWCWESWRHVSPSVSGYANPHFASAVDL